MFNSLTTQLFKSGSADTQLKGIDHLRAQDLRKKKIQNTHTHTHTAFGGERDTRFSKCLNKIFKQRGKKNKKQVFPLKKISTNETRVSYKHLLIFMAF